MNRIAWTWMSAGCLLVTACHEAIPCITEGAIKQHGICDCPPGTSFSIADDGTQSCGTGGDGGGSMLHSDASSADAALRDGRASDPRDASGDAASAQDASDPARDDAGLIRDAGPSQDAAQTPDAAHGSSGDDASMPTCTLNACGKCGALPVEVCDGADNDCDGAFDEGCKFFYKDCDQDGFAVNATGRVFAMSAPVSLNDCLGWTTKQPVDDGSTDCDDTRKTRYPGAPPGLPISSPGETLPPLGDAAWDLNCDGMAVATNPLVTGQVSNGVPVLVQWCDPPVETCIQQIDCIDSWHFSGIPSCGVNYTTTYVCGGSGPAYYECQ